MNALADLLPGHLKEGSTPAERKVLKCLPLGTVADFRSEEELKDDSAQWAQWSRERTIRANLLAHVCTDRQIRDWVHPKGIQVRGARIHGELDLEGAAIPAVVFSSWY